jgi:hypothetical protein
LCSDVTILQLRFLLFSLFSGYKAPEYASQGIYSLKTDVFSFGVLVLVIISGRKNTILDKRGDTVGCLVRDVSEVNIYFTPGSYSYTLMIVSVNSWPIYIFRVTRILKIGFSNAVLSCQCFWKTISGLAYVEGPKVA